MRIASRFIATMFMCCTLWAHVFSQTKSGHAFPNGEFPLLFLGIISTHCCYLVSPCGDYIHPLLLPCLSLWGLYPPTVVTLSLPLGIISTHGCYRVSPCGDYILPRLIPCLSLCSPVQVIELDNYIYTTNELLLALW